MTPHLRKLIICAGTRVKEGDFIITGIDEKSLTKNCLVKSDAFRGATSVDINHHI